MVNAIYYDGVNVQQHVVNLSLQAGIVQVHEGARLLVETPITEVAISQKLGNVPRQINFKDGSRCVIKNHDAFEAMLESAGYQPQSFASRLESRWHYALLALMLILGAIAVTYRWGLPWAANVAAKNVPDSVTKHMDEQSLVFLDQLYLKPTKLSKARQDALQKSFDGLRPAVNSNIPAHHIIFRSAPEIGPNAFAMPGGTMVLLDELVDLADESLINKHLVKTEKNNEKDANAEVMGVLSHELGHIQKRHAMRQLIQGSVVAIAMTWYVGDISSLLATVPTALLQTKYSRDFERQADDFAIETLRANDISPNHLAMMFRKLAAYSQQDELNLSKATRKAKDNVKGGVSAKNSSNPPKESTQTTDATGVAKVDKKDAPFDMSDYFSSHPATEERIQHIEASAK